MTRTLKTAKTAGSSFERSIADYLAKALDNPDIDRRIRYGQKDRGDIRGIKIHGWRKLVIECKNTTRLSLPEWINEAHIEAGNDDALCGIVVSKRNRVQDPARQWVHMELRDLISLITGEQQHGCNGMGEP